MRKGFAPILIILGLLVIISVSTGGFYLYQSRDKTKPTIQTDSQIVVKSTPQPLANLSSPSTSPGPTPVSSSDISKWTDLNQDSWGVKLKCPLEWACQVNKDSIYLVNPKFANQPKNINIFTITDSSLNHPSYTKVLDWFSALKNKNPEANKGFLPGNVSYGDNPKPFYSSYDLSQIYETTINNTTSLVIPLKINDATEILIPLKDKVVKVIVMPFSSFNFPVVAQILSTFKF